jgi:hypothetical protein
MPSAYDGLGGRLVEDLGFMAVYIGGLRHRRLTVHVGAAPHDGADLVAFLKLSPRVPTRTLAFLEQSGIASGLLTANQDFR